MENSRKDLPRRHRKPTVDRGAMRSTFWKTRTQAAQHELAARPMPAPTCLRYLAMHGAARPAARGGRQSAAPAARQPPARPTTKTMRCAPNWRRKIARLMPGPVPRRGRSCCATRRSRRWRGWRATRPPRVRAILAEEIKYLDCVPKPWSKAGARRRSGRRRADPGIFAAAVRRRPDRDHRRRPGRRRCCMPSPAAGR